MFIYINKHGTLFKQKNNKKHVEIHTAGRAGVGDTVPCDRESVEPVCRGLSVFICPITAGSYMYIYKTRYISHVRKTKKIKGGCFITYHCFHYWYVFQSFNGPWSGHLQYKLRNTMVLARIRK